MSASAWFAKMREELEWAEKIARQQEELARRDHEENVDCHNSLWKLRNEILELKKALGKHMARRHPSRALRAKVIERDGLVCRYCLAEVPEDDVHIDHVYPHSMGGVTELENLVVSCPTCNIRKKDKLGIWPLPLPEID